MRMCVHSAYGCFLPDDLGPDVPPLDAAGQSAAAVGVGVQESVRQAVTEGQRGSGRRVKEGLSAVELRRWRLFTWPAGWTLWFFCCSADSVCSPAWMVKANDKVLILEFKEKQLLSWRHSPSPCLWASFSWDKRETEWLLCAISCEYREGKL